MPQFPFLLIFNATAIRTKLHIYVSTADAKFIFDLGIDEFVPTFEAGIIGWIPVHRGLRFPFATQVHSVDLSCSFCLIHISVTPDQNESE